MAAWGERSATGRSSGNGIGRGAGAFGIRSTSTCDVAPALDAPHERHTAALHPHARRGIHLALIELARIDAEIHELASKISRRGGPRLLQALRACRASGRPAARLLHRRAVSRSTLKVVTWNIHAAVGLDGVRSIDRVADALRALDADVMCLQELDVGRSRSGGVDQPAALALRLGVTHVFGAAMRDGEASYGNAILSRLPLLEPRVVALPGLRFTEPRAATLASIDSPLGRVGVIATHLGLLPFDRSRQAEALAAEVERDGEHRWIVAGDFNELPRRGGAVSRIARRLTRAASGATFPARWPLLALDHVLVHAQLRVTEVRPVPASEVHGASDHLPVLVTLTCA